MRKFSLLLAPVLVMLALAACSGATDRPAIEPAPLQEAAGDLPPEFAGSTLTATAYNPETDTFFDVGSAEVAADGSFELPLPETVAAEHLQSSSVAFGCEGLPEFNVAQVPGLNLSTPEGGNEYAFFAPEGSSADTMPSEFALLVYSDRAVEVDTSCTPPSAEVEMASGSVERYRFLVSLLLGWNLLLYSQESGIVTYESLANAEAYRWFIYSGP